MALLATAFLLSHTTAVNAEQSLKAYKAHYRVSKGTFAIGSANITLTLSDDGRYQYRAYTTPVGLAAVFRKDEITELSDGHIENNRIIPDHYLYNHKKPKKQRKVSLDFDWENQRVANKTADSHWSMEIPVGTQDKFSQQLSLMLSLCRGESSATFQVADGGLLKTYQYTQVEEESIRTEAGEYQTLKLARNKDNKPSKATLWFAPNLNYLPVKIAKHEKDGDYVMELISVKWEGPASN
ncbi:MAG: DUF3108 domain-containing protein [Sedimenticola sp.]|nr:DUF3108 domain-containing protein [Sedimenticola sp.]